MRVIGFCCIVIGSSGYGFYMAYCLIQRLKQLRQLYQLLGMLQGEIRYQNAVLEEAFIAIERRLIGWQKCFLEELYLKLITETEQPLEQVWREAVKQLPSYTAFEEEEIKILLELGGQLGYLDREMQLTTIELYKNHMANLIEELENQKIEKCRLYRTLGVASGMLVALLLL